MMYIAHITSTGKFPPAIHFSASLAHPRFFVTMVLLFQRLQSVLPDKVVLHPNRILFLTEVISVCHPDSPIMGASDMHQASTSKIPLSMSIMDDILKITKRIPQIHIIPLLPGGIMTKQSCKTKMSFQDQDREQYQVIVKTRCLSRPQYMDFS